MLLPADAFAHVPALAGKVLEPEKSVLRISRETFVEWDRRAEAAGYGANWRRTHEEREATRSEALAGRLGRDLWIFAYGSLMWDPAIHVVEIRTATLTGLTRDGVWWIEKGKIAYPVRNLRFNQSMVQMLAAGNVEMVGAPERVGASEDQGSSAGLMPALKLRGFNFTSQSEAV